MKLAIVILAVVVLLFAATLVLVGSGMKLSGLEPPPTKTDGSVDEDALSDWHPPSLASLIANHGSWFTPHADFGAKSVVLNPGTSRVVTAKQSGKDLEIAKLKISDGALLVTYVCTHSKDGSSCSQTVCLCTPGSALITPAVAFCRNDSQWKQGATGGICTDRERQAATVLVYPEARDVSLTALGPAVTVNLK